jgi:hypothetical protein
MDDDEGRAEQMRQDKYREWGSRGLDGKYYPTDGYGTICDGGGTPEVGAVWGGPRINLSDRELREEREWREQQKMCEREEARHGFRLSLRLSVVFAVTLLVLISFSWYQSEYSPWIVGTIIALALFLCLLIYDTYSSYSDWKRRA